MLDLFRKRGLSSIIYGVIIVATVLVFVIQFRPNAGEKSASLKEACVATVRGYCVEPKAERAAYRVLTPRDQSGNLLTGRAKSMGLSKIAVDGIVERELLITEADRIGLSVTEDELNDSLYDGFIYVSVPSDNPSLSYSLGVHDGHVYAGFRDQKTKQFDMKVYERSVRMITGRSPTEFREWQAREILAAKMRDLVRAPVRVSEPEALEMYVAEKSSATVQYAQVNTDWVERFALKFTQGDVDAWLTDKANSAQVKSPIIRHILIKTDADAGASGKEEARTKILAALARVKKGEDFAAVAKDVSQDSGSAVEGGAVGDKTDGFVEPFKKAADALKPGEMTQEPVETEFGFHIIKKDEPARAAFKKAKSLELAKRIADKIQADVKGGASLEDATKNAIATFAIKTKPAEDHPAKPDMSGDGGAPPAKPFVDTADTDAERPQAQTSTPFNRGGDPIPALGMDGSAKLAEFAFTAKEGDLAPAPLRGEDGYVVVLLKSKKAATRDDFDKERDTYLATILAAKQAEALSIYVRRLREDAKQDIKIDETYMIDAKPDGGAPAPQEDEDEGP